MSLTSLIPSQVLEKCNSLIPVLIWSSHVIAFHQPLFFHPSHRRVTGLPLHKPTPPQPTFMHHCKDGFNPYGPILFLRNIWFLISFIMSTLPPQHWHICNFHLSYFHFMLYNRLNKMRIHLNFQRN